MEPSPELFSNPQMDLQALPKAESQAMISLEPAFKTVRYLGAVLFGAALMIAAALVLFFKPDLGIYGVTGFGMITLMAIWNVVYQGIAFPYMTYAVREKDITYQSGWLWKSMTTVPFNRVQHCDIRQGLLDRQFGLAKLTIYTAGGQNTDVEIPGLLPDTAERLKTFILRATELSIENE